MALISIFSLTTAAVAQRTALVIGNGGYDFVRGLPNPDNDARAIGATLAGIGFDVDLVVDGDLETLRAALDSFAENAQGAETALVYYAGHGMQVSGSNYLLPVDIRIRRQEDLDAGAIAVDEVFEAFNFANPETAILILDACRDNPLAAALGTGQGLASGTVTSRSNRPNSAGIVIAFSAAPGAVASDGADGNSPYTAALLQWIDRPGLELATMLRRVRGTVLQLTDGEQVPWVEEALVQDVYLNPAPAPPAGADGERIEVALLESIRGLSTESEQTAARQFYDRYLVNASLDGGGATGMDEDQRLVQAGLIWLSIRQSEDPRIFQAYVEEFPGLAFTDLARERMAELDGRPEPGAENLAWLDQLPPVPPRPSEPEPIQTAELVDPGEARPPVSTDAGEPPAAVIRPTLSLPQIGSEPSASGPRLVPTAPAEPAATEVAEEPAEAAPPEEIEVAELPAEPLPVEVPEVPETADLPREEPAPVAPSVVVIPRPDRVTTQTAEISQPEAGEAPARPVRPSGPAVSGRDGTGARPVLPSPRIGQTPAETGPEETPEEIIVAELPPEVIERPVSPRAPAESSLGTSPAVPGRPAGDETIPVAVPPAGPSVAPGSEPSVADQLPEVPEQAPASEPQEEPVIEVADLPPEPLPPVPPAPAPTPEELEAELGFTEAERAAVQMLLAEAGLYSGGIDADFGPGTRGAITRFQESTDLPATGHLDIETLRQLVARTARAVLGDVDGARRGDIHHVAAVAARGPGAEPEVVRVEAIDRNQTVHSYWREIADDFEADHPGTMIEINHRPGVRYRTELMALLGSETPPDILYTWSGGHLDALREAGFARDLTDVMADGWAFEFKPGALQTYTHEGRIYGVPMHLSLISLYANRAVFERAGIPLEQVETWDGFLAAVQQFRAQGITPMAIGGGDRWPFSLYFGELAQRLGGREAMEGALHGTGDGFDGSVFRTAGAAYETFVDMQPFQEGYLDMDDGRAVEMFANGEAAMVVTGNWRLQRMFWDWPGGQAQMDRELAQLDFPLFGDLPQDTLTYGGADGFAVATEAPDIAVDFLRRLTAIDVQERMTEIASSIPASSGADLSMRGGPLEDAAEQLLNSTYHQLFIDQALGIEAGNLLNDMLIQVATGEIGADAAVVALDDAWTRILDGSD